MKNVHEIHRVIREQLLVEMPVSGRICFSYLQPYDAGPAQLGNLFEQNDDFLMAEVEVDEVRRAGPGVHAPRRVWGHLALTLFTKERLDPIRAISELESVSDLFREQTLSGVRFRDYSPTAEMRDRGFNAHAGVIPFDFETRAMRNE